LEKLREIGVENSCRCRISTGNSRNWCTAWRGLSCR